jgi:flagellar hook-length control protein FliK
MNTSNSSIHSLSAKPPLPSLLTAGNAAPSTASQELSASFSEMLRSKVQPAATPAPQPQPPAKSEAPKAQASGSNNSEAAAASKNQDANRLQQHQQEQRRLQERQQQARHDTPSADKAAAGKHADKTAEPKDGDATEAASEREERSATEATANPALAGQQAGPARPATELASARGLGAADTVTGEERDSALPTDAAALLAGPAKTNPGVAKGGKVEADGALQKAGLDAHAARTAALPAQGQDAVAATGAQAPGAIAVAAAAAAPGQPSFESLLSAAAAQQGQPTGDTVSTPSSATPTHLSLAPELHESAFAPEMAARLSVLAADGVQEARLHLNPSEMGPVLVQIQLDGQQAQISFHAEQAETRAVLENSLPELAAALRENGLTLSGGGVFQQARDPGQSGGQDGQAGSARHATAAPAGTDSEPGPLMTMPRQQATRGVLDMYA